MIQSRLLGGDLETFCNLIPDSWKGFLSWTHSSFLSFYIMTGIPNKSEARLAVWKAKFPNMMLLSPKTNELTIKVSPVSGAERYYDQAFTTAQEWQQYVNSKRVKY